MNTSIINNYKKIFNLTFAALCGLLLFISCDDINSSTEKEPPVEKAITAKQMQNPNNPYDIEGTMHNNFLDFFGEQLTKDSKINQERTLQIVQDFYTQNKKEFGRTDQRFYSQLFETYTQLEIGKTMTTPELVSSTLCDVYPIICDILNPTGPFNPYMLSTGGLGEDEGGTSTERTLKFIATSIEQENKLIRDKEISEEHKYVILNYLTVARHSAAYWHNAVYIQKDKSPYYKDWILNDSDKGICTACRVVGADALGGAIGGAIGGALGGPAGEDVGSGIGSGVLSAAAALKDFLW